MGETSTEDAEALRRQVRYTDELKDELEALKVKLAAALVVAETQAEEIAELRETKCERVHVDPDLQHLLDIIDRQAAQLTTQAEELERLSKALDIAATEADTYILRSQTQAEELDRQTVIAEARLAQINQVLTDNADLRQKLLAQAEELAELKSLNRKHDTETTSIHRDMLALGRLVGVPYDGVSSPAGYLHGAIMPKLTTQAEELERLRAADAEWKADTLQEQAARIVAQAEELERFRATTKRLIGVRTTITVNGKPTEVVFSPDDVTLLYESTTQGDQEP